MANDKDQGTKDQTGKAGQSGQKREIGEGMHSLDSTQAPLKAETGEVDWDAKNGRVSSDTDKDSSSSSDKNR